MSDQKAALVVIDVQESFRHMPYWSDVDLERFVEKQQSLIDGAKLAGIPIVQIFHTREGSPFDLKNGFVRTLDELNLEPDATFYKQRHSALVGTGLDVWLTQRGISRLIISGIRTEQCCETTTRHASDIGFNVDFISEAMMTFEMQHADGTTYDVADIRKRTELVLAGRFATISSVEGVLRSLEQKDAA